MKIFVFSCLCLVLASCSAAHSNKMSYTQMEREKWRLQAEEGNAEAQYQLGNAWCCGEGGFFSTKEATKWWCKASEQGHKKAMKTLKKKDAICRTGAPLS